MTQNETLNVAYRLVDMARERPDAIAIAEPCFTSVPWYLGGRFRKKRPLRDPSGKRIYKTVTFCELNRDSDRIAYALREAGFLPGMRIALMVRQGIDFITLVFALYKAGLVLVLIDPGMGLRRMLRCLEEVEPDGFVAIPSVQYVRRFLQKRFSKAVHNLTVGPRRFWGGLTLAKIRSRAPGESLMESTRPEDPAAIIFTSGSTGLAKGVLYSHRIIDQQVMRIAERYDIQPGEVDLAGFPFFGLFNAAMGTTAVLPDMDSSRPASVDPVLFLEAAEDWQITQSFGSPALWNRIVQYCTDHHLRIKTLKRAISAGAPVSFALLEKFQRCIAEDGEIYTPYGATESLPVASIGSREVLNETAKETRKGKGICVGTSFGGIEWRIIPISDLPIEQMERVEPVCPGDIGELVVTGPQVTRRYVTRLEANAFAKITDRENRIWHRIGDVGYIDSKNRFWFCGRKAHRVETKDRTYFSIPCESIANEHSDVFRSALVGIRNSSGEKEPVLIVEPFADLFPKTEKARAQLIKEVGERLQLSEVTQGISRVLILPKFPVDVRHNAKINRELLAEWANKTK